ncbi:MAG: hypothetical protein MJA27_20035 [Pseudanabaenales cyanobacterium]|nr:hypothetical protein [Pseudanabaenales cyanobacterium]
MTTKIMTPQSTTSAPVSEETKALVEQKMADQPDEIKQKMAELVDLIKQRAEAELQEAGVITREAYAKAIGNAKETLGKTQAFFEEQEKSLEQSIQDLTAKTNEKWDAFVADVKQMSDRFDSAVEAAWKSLTESEPKA